MPKLLIVTTVASTLRAFLLPYAQHFKKTGWTVDAMANGVSDCPVCAEAFDKCHEMPFSRSPLNFTNYGNINTKIREIVAEEQYDIIHVHTPIAAFVTRFALQKMRKAQEKADKAKKIKEAKEVKEIEKNQEKIKFPKIIYTAHGFHFYKGGNIFKNMFFIMLEKMAGKWTDHIITINKEDYQAALEYKIAGKQHLSLLPGIGLDFEHYSADKVDVAKIKKFHASLKLKNTDELFFMAAEFNAGKRHKDAIHALAETGRTNFHLAFAGAGPLEDSMKQLASKLGVESRVHFLGEREDVPVLMLSSRATILPSGREGLSRSVMESICLGIPVLGANARGIRDLINSPERGSLFPVGNHAALAAAMILLVDNRSLAKPNSDSRWNINYILNEHETLYKSIRGR